MIGGHFLARLPALLRAALLESANSVATRAAELTPKQSGELAASIGVEEDERGVRIIAGAPYANIVELGSYKRAPQPFLRPALLQEREAVRERVLAALKETQNDRPA